MARHENRKRRGGDENKYYLIRFYVRITVLFWLLYYKHKTKQFEGSAHCCFPHFQANGCFHRHCIIYFDMYCIFVTLCIVDISQFSNGKPITLRWRHNGHGGVSNHQPHHCLLNRLFGCRSKKTSKLCVTGLCVGNWPGTGEFPAQMTSNAENFSIWWRHHEIILCPFPICGWASSYSMNM